jgi:hypothetical protein
MQSPESSLLIAHRLCHHHICPDRAPRSQGEAAPLQSADSSGPVRMCACQEGCAASRSLSRRCCGGVARPDEAWMGGGEEEEGERG